MSRILEDLYFGEIQPNIIDYDEDPRLRKSAQTVSENEEILLNLLEGKERKLFLDLVNAQGEVDGASAAKNFINGFKIGAKIIVESVLEP